MLTTHRESHVFGWVLALIMAALLSCQPKPPALPASDPVAEPAAPSTKITPPAAPETPKPEPIRITILLSGRAPEYDAVSAELLALAGPEQVEVIQLDGKPSEARRAIAAIEAAGESNVVSIGLFAARIAQTLRQANVVFCQVLNYGAHELGSERMHGIEAIPRIDKAAATWKKLNPKLQRIGVITGDGHDAWIRRAASSLQNLGIELRHQVSSSDKETMVAFTRMLSEVDGYWLVPDNRVLSRNALRELMLTARRAGIGVLVHDESLLAMGGLIGSFSQPAEISAMAFEMLSDARKSGQFPAPVVRPLRESTIQVHAEMARQLGYDPSVIPDMLWSR